MRVQAISKTSPKPHARNRFNSISRLALAWVLAIWLAPQTVFAQDEAAVQVVETFQNTLLEIMKDAKTLGYQGRFDKLAPAIESSHDLAGIVKFASGRYWSTLDEAQKKALIDTFGKLSIATYAYRFNSYDGETFKSAGSEALANGDRLVHTEFTESGGEQHRFDYTLHPVNGQWRIINVVVDGVSDLAIKRSEYTSLLRSKGVEALIDKLKAQIDQYSKPA